MLTKPSLSIFLAIGPLKPTLMRRALKLNAQEALHAKLQVSGEVLEQRIFRSQQFWRVYVAYGLCAIWGQMTIIYEYISQKFIKSFVSWNIYCIFHNITVTIVNSKYVVICAQSRFLLQFWVQLCDIPKYSYSANELII